jgi:protein involved in polysaccharide export with SLBB domain
MRYLIRVSKQLPLIGMILNLLACAPTLDMGGHPLAQIDHRGSSASPINVSQIPKRPTTILQGDMLRITRDFIDDRTSEEQSFLVRPDGSFAYPFIGLVHAKGKSPEELADELGRRLAEVYSNSKVTVNIVSSPANRIFVGGEVRSPGQFPLAGGVTLQQAIYFAGGLVPTADPENIALLRENAKGAYDVYFVNTEALFYVDDSQRMAIYLEPQDIVIIPKSWVGNAIEIVDLYLNRLIPFQKNLSFGAFYNLLL